MNDAHWVYIALAYGVTAAVVGVLALRIVLEHRRLRAELDRLETKAADEHSEASS